jgi:hypothetical protein
VETELVAPVAPELEVPVELEVPLVVLEVVGVVLVLELVVGVVLVLVVVEPEPEEPDAVVAVWAAVVVLRWLASAGSWPVTSVIVINIHVARNRATAPPTTRRRIILVRATRALRIWVASFEVMLDRIGPLRRTGVWRG